MAEILFVILKSLFLFISYSCFMSFTFIYVSSMGGTEF